MFQFDSAPKKATKLSLNSKVLEMARAQRRSRFPPPVGTQGEEVHL